MEGMLEALSYGKELPTQEIQSILRLPVSA